MIVLGFHILQVTYSHSVKCYIQKIFFSCLQNIINREIINKPYSCYNMSINTFLLLVPKCLQVNSKSLSGHIHLKPLL